MGIAGPDSAAASSARTVLLIVLGFLAALGLVAGGTLFYLYDRATAIDRSTPQVVTEQFLDAALMINDPDRVALLVCNRWSASDAMLAVARPADPHVAASWGDLSTTIAGDRAMVAVRVEFSIDAGPVDGSSVRAWNLELTNEDGWRVCGLTKSPVPSPSQGASSGDLGVDGVVRSLSTLSTPRSTSGSHDMGAQRRRGLDVEDEAGRSHRL